MAYKINKNKGGYSAFQKMATGFQKLVGPSYGGAGTAVPDENFFEFFFPKIFL